MGFPRQEYWSRLPFAFPGDLPDPGIEHASPVLVSRFFTTEPPDKPLSPFKRALIKFLCPWTLAQAMTSR